MKKIAIIGAGISGLFVANLFQQNTDYQVTIYEKNNSINLDDGYGIQLSINSINLLNRIGFNTLENKDRFNPKKIDFYEIKQKKVFGISKRSSDYAQALMELGALVCRPNNPLCNQCPISKKCKSFVKKDFVLTKIKKINKDKYFLLKVYKKDNKYLLVKNKKFNFLKNFSIFPMQELNKPKNFNQNLNFKMSNMNMNIEIKNDKIKKPIPFSYWIDPKKLQNYTLPTFTKTIFKYLENHK